ncbi:MAG: hypothetical protein LQ351_003339 [Letrouitia transgressa]|nr:MAG: hypothetical protein LQ351_003339 [Letrouitia transgressa]
MDNPNTVTVRWQERRLSKKGIQPVGSRRRRAALKSTSSIPFEQLPYQCFQEARRILLQDREEKLKQIEEERKRIAKIQSVPAIQLGGENCKKAKLVRMQRYLEHLKILADINDPVIKKRYEDGLGDMNRPIYRFLADREWRKYRRLITIQRINQMHIIPDVLPHLDPTAEVTLWFGRRKIPPGELVDSRISETPAKLTVQVFDRGERLLSVIVVDPDVPNMEIDEFLYRCHFLGVNIPVGPAKPLLPLALLSTETQIAIPWIPPHAQKGSPYHRLSTFVLQQREGERLDLQVVQDYLKGKAQFNLRSFRDRFLLKPVGVHMFRTIWDEGTVGVMSRAGIEGADIELRRPKPEKLPYKKKDSKLYR